MFGLVTNLAKAAVGTVLVAPASMVADVVTMGGALTDKNEPYTASALRDVLQNLEDAVDPNKD